MGAICSAEPPKPKLKRATTLPTTKLAAAEPPTAAKKPHYGFWAVVFLTVVSTMATFVALAMGKFGSASPANLASGPFQASTTDFQFYSQTACGCNSPNTLAANLAAINWYGAATPAWLGSSYLGGSNAGYNCGACPGGTCNAGVSTAGTPYNNCANGAGGCGKCLELTVLDEANIYGVKNVAPGTVIHAVVMDNCEMNNQYGDNEQWCVPFSNAPTGGCKMEGNGYPSCVSPQCESGAALAQVGGKWKGGTWDFSAQCGTLDAFTCTNAAGRPAHVDLAIQNVANPPWVAGSNPVVSAAYVTCPDNVVSLIKASCQSQAGVSCALPDL